MITIMINDPGKIDPAFADHGSVSCDFEGFILVLDIVEEMPDDFILVQSMHEADGDRVLSRFVRKCRNAERPQYGDPFQKELIQRFQFLRPCRFIARVHQPTFRIFAISAGSCLGFSSNRRSSCTISSVSAIAEDLSQNRNCMGLTR